MKAKNQHAYDQILRSLERRGAIMKVTDDQSLIEAKFLDDSVATIAWYALGRSYGKGDAASFQYHGVLPIRSDDLMTLTFKFKIE